MIIFNDKYSHKFEDKKINRIHIPRIYINNFSQISEAINILKEKKYLNNSEMTKETARIRAEHIREILIILWRLDIGVDVVRQKKSYSFKLKKNNLKILIDENEYKKEIIEKLKLYVPMGAVLQSIKEIINKKEVWNENKIEKLFHFSNSKGNSDNIHPLIRWLKGFDLITEDLKISNKGDQYLNELKKLNPFYVHEVLDFDNEKLAIIFAEIFHQLSLNYSFNSPLLIELNSLEKLNFLSDLSKKFLIENKNKIFHTIEKFIKNGLPLEFKKSKLFLKNPIFFDIKPKNYINFQLNNFFRDESNIEIFKIKKKSFIKSQFFLIKDKNQKCDLNIFPKNINIVTYEEFEENKNEIIDQKPKFIILAKGWKPIKNIEISGYLNAYVRFGGNLIVIGGQGGRIGANMNMFSWLPYELTKINFLKHKNKSYFKFTFGENLNQIKILKSSKLEKENCYKFLILSYFSGTITFTNDENNQIEFDNNIFSKNLQISSLDNNWLNSEIIHKCATTKGERKMYPIIKEFMKKNFNFEFDHTILGHSGQTDIFVNRPFYCLFEVDTVGVNQIVCGASKVSEVDRHYRKMKKQKFFTEASKCVVGYEFSSISGEDREGTIETAKDYSVNLIRYKDLYDMSCIKNLSENDIKKIIYDYDPESPEVSKKIIKLYEKYKNF